MYVYRCVYTQVICIYVNKSTYIHTEHDRRMCMSVCMYTKYVYVSMYVHEMYVYVSMYQYVKYVYVTRVSM